MSQRKHMRSNTQETSMNNIFIEGIQGTGKSTLLQKLQTRLCDYTIYREGDYSPVELAWCSYMTKMQLKEVCIKYEAIQKEILNHTHTQGEYKIITYTKILTDILGFHKFMESFEIYNGNVSFEKFAEIILKRFEAFSQEGNIFECSFFQNSIETMLLYYELPEEAIVQFYENVFEILKDKKFKLLYLKAQDIEETIDIIRKERSDENGNELWFPLMMEYLKQSPYGKANHLHEKKDLIAHFIRRSELEQKIIKNFPKEMVFVIPAKHYELEKIVAWCISE